LSDTEGQPFFLCCPDKKAPKRVYYVESLLFLHNTNCFQARNTVKVTAMKRLFVLLNLVGLLSISCESGVEWLGDGTGNNGQHNNKPSDDKDDTSANNKTQGIYFQDNNTRQICIQYWDKDGDNEISYEEASSVSDIGSVFTSSSISHFNEFQYFTGVKEVPTGAFSDCINLAEITLPKHIVSIKDRAFQRCMVLKRVVLPDAVTDIGSYAFSDCLALSSILLPRNIRDIGNSAFYNCLGTLTINSKFIETHQYSIEGEHWLSDAGFTTIIIGDNITTIGATAFRDAKSLNNVMIPEGVISIKDAAFYGCSALNSVYCRAETPPTLSPYVFHNTAGNCKFYVPKASVEMYRTSDLWSFYAADIMEYF
jgi:hypothetical protein